jgi:hypothetical protein
MSEFKTDHFRHAPWRRLALAAVLCAFLGGGVSRAQIAEAGVWPPTGRDQWFAIDVKTDRDPGQIQAAFNQALVEEMAFLDPGFNATVFFAKRIRVTKGKAGNRKKHPGQPEKADDLRFEAEWQTGYLNQHRGSTYRFIALEAIRSLDLHFVPNLRERFPKVPPGRNWNVNILAGPLLGFFFRTEEAARGFINAVASLLEQRGFILKLSRFGLMWENITATQAADMKRSEPGGVLVTRVAIAGAAERGGVRPLDVILEVNGARVKNFSHCALLLEGIAPGAKATLLLLRRLRAPDQYPEASAWDTLTVEIGDR